jgi:hypothetical protein
MRVLLGSGPDPVGDAAASATRMAEGLRTLGVDAAVSGALAPDLSDFDLIHLFGTVPAEPSFRQVLRSRGAGLPIVLTPLWRDPPRSEPLAGTAGDLLGRRDSVMRLVTFGLASALTPSSQDELDEISSRLPVVPGRVAVVPLGGAEATLTVYNAVMDEHGQPSSEGDWRAAFTPEEYIEHLESLVQLQLEAIALRDGHFAGAVAHAENLEADRQAREEYIRRLEGSRGRIRRGLSDRLRLLRR